MMTKIKQDNCFFPLTLLLEWKDVGLCALKNDPKELILTFVCLF